MAVSVEYVKKLSKMKIEDVTDASPLMATLKNLVVFEDNIPDEDKELAA